MLFAFVLTSCPSCETSVVSAPHPIIKMRILALILLVVLSVGAQSPAPAENARKARELIDQMIAALGGQAYLTVQDVQQQGRSYGFYHGQPRGVGAPFFRFWRWPDKDRTEFTRQRDIITIFSGDQGHEITFRGIGSVEPKELASYLLRRHYSLENVLRRWLAEPDVAFFYEGSTIRQLKKVEQVSIMNSRSEAVTIYIDVNTHLPVEKSFTWRDPSTRERNEETETFDNYRPVQGVMTPHTTTRSRNGEMVNQRFINSVIYNAGLPDSLFVPTKLAQARKQTLPLIRAQKD
jgi:hypothetical protein